TLLMSTRWLLLTLLCVALIAGGQLLFRSAAEQWQINGWSMSTLRSLLSPVMLLALITYALATILWVFILRSVPLALAYPVFALAFLIVPIMAYFAFGEPVPLRTLVGGA